MVAEFRHNRIHGCNGSGDLRLGLQHLFQPGASCQHSAAGGSDRHPDPRRSTGVAEPDRDPDGDPDLVSNCYSYPICGHRLVAPTAGAAPQPTPVVSQPEPTQPPAAVQQPASGQGTATIRVIADGDIQVTVEADGAIVFSGWLGSGSSTEFFTGANFAVTTSDGSLTLFENAATGQQFYMGYGQNETYYLGSWLIQRSGVTTCSPEGIIVNCRGVVPRGSPSNSTGRGGTASISTNFARLWVTCGDRSSCCLPA